jgi:hypothetical protein
VKPDGSVFRFNPFPGFLQLFESRPFSFRIGICRFDLEVLGDALEIRDARAFGGKRGLMIRILTGDRHRSRASFRPLHNLYRGHIGAVEVPSSMVSERELGFAHKVGEMDIPRLSKAGRLRH